MPEQMLLLKSKRGITGSDPLMLDVCDLNIIVPSDDTARIQEMHILIGHILCQLVDNEYR